MAGTLAYLQAAEDTVDRSSYTFSAQDFGAEASDRILLVIVHYRASTMPALNSVTIGGVGASLVATAATDGNARTALYAAAVPTGTSGSVAVSLSAAALRCVVELYRATGIEASAHATATDTGSPFTQSIDVPAGGVALAGGQSAGISAVSWSGLTERSEALVESVMRYSSASGEFAAAQSPLAITATVTGTANGPTFVFASFAPASGGGSVVPLVVHHMRMQGMA